MIGLRVAFRSLADGHRFRLSVLMPCIALFISAPGCGQHDAENVRQVAAGARADSQVSSEPLTSDAAAVRQETSPIKPGGAPAESKSGGTAADQSGENGRPQQAANKRSPDNPPVEEAEPVGDVTTIHYWLPRRTTAIG